jgi:hypothetical protein
MPHDADLKKQMKPLPEIYSISGSNPRSAVRNACDAVSAARLRCSFREPPTGGERNEQRKRNFNTVIPILNRN